MPGDLENAQIEKAKSEQRKTEVEMLRGILGDPHVPETLKARAIEKMASLIDY